jgi:tetratricopeptide (TPR) repeat protein
VVAGLAGVVILLVLTVVVGATVFAVRLGHALTETEAARDRAETSRRQTRLALDTLTDQAVERMLARQTQLTTEDRAFWNRVVELHETFAKADGDTPDARAEVAKARTQIGRIRHRLGEYAAAEESLRVAVAELQPLADAHSDRPTFRRDLARTQTNLCNLLRETGRPGPAEAAGRAAVDLLQALADADPDQTEYWIELARAQHNLAIVLLITDQLGPAEDAERAAIRHLKDRAVLPADRQALAIGHTGLGNVLRTAENWGPAEESYRTSQDLLQKLIDEFPDQPEYQRELASLLNNLAPVYALTDRRPKALETFQRSADVMRNLVEKYPTRPDYRRLLGSTQSNLGNLLTRMKRREEAEVAYRAAQASYERLVADSPQVAENRNALAGVFAGLALLKSVGKDDKAARTLIDQALVHDRAAVQAEPKNPAYRQAYRTHQGILTEILIGLDDHIGAAAAAEELIAIAHDPATDAWLAARVLARCAPLAEEDEKRPAAERKELARTYADRAVAHLQLAVRNGLRDPKRLRGERWFEPLFDRDDFKQLLRELDPTGR